MNGLNVILCINKIEYISGKTCTSPNKPSPLFGPLGPNPVPMGPLGPKGPGGGPLGPGPGPLKKAGGGGAIKGGGRFC